MKIVKPVSEHDANKIVTLNVETDDLDNAVAGMLTFSLAGSSDVTLTRVQALNKVFKFTGALTSSITVFFPVVLGSAREFVVWNATTGAFTLTIKTTTGASAGVIVTQGTKPVLFHDGTDVLAISSSGAGTGDALVANPLSQFAATTSAQLAGVITNETGTGLLVFNDTPTLNTPVISGAVSFPDGVRQTFNPNATVAGLNVGSQAGDPSTPINGDIWYDSTANTLDARINGATVNLGAGGGGGDVTAAANFGTDNRLIRSDGTTKGVQSSGITIDDSNNVTGVNSISVGDGTVAGESKLFELTANGSNYISLLAPDAITNTLALKFPNADPTAGQALVYGAPSSNVSTGAWVTVGYLEIPSNSQSANYTLVLADSGKSIDHPSTDANARTFTIPANASVAFPVGTAVSFSNMTSQVVSIAITTDTMYLAGAGTTGTRSLAQYGTATARKLTSTTWLISGVGLT